MLAIWVEVKPEICSGVSASIWSTVRGATDVAERPPSCVDVMLACCTGVSAPIRVSAKLLICATVSALICGPVIAANCVTVKALSSVDVRLPIC